MLTDRDIAILKFINQFGFCVMPHLNERFGLRKSYNYELIGRLIDKGLVIHEEGFRKQGGVYRLTKKGASFTELPPLKNVPWGIFRHEVLLVHLHFKLMEKYPDAIWFSERELNYDHTFDGIGKRGHLPDGLLEFKDGKKVLIELELSRKGERRLKKILDHYALQLGIEDEAWYVCDDEVIPLLTKATINKPFIKVLRLQDILDAQP